MSPDSIQGFPPGGRWGTLEKARRKLRVDLSEEELVFCLRSMLRTFHEASMLSHCVLSKREDKNCPQSFEESKDREQRREKMS